MPIQILKATATFAAVGLEHVVTLRRPIVDAASKVIVHAVILRSMTNNYFGQAWAYFIDADLVNLINIGLGNKIVPNLYIGAAWQGIVEWPAEWFLRIGANNNETNMVMRATVIYEVVPIEAYRKWW